MILIIDNYDSFTYNLVEYISILGQECEVVLNDDERLLDLDLSYYDAIILSPGPGLPSDYPILQNFVKRLVEIKIPTLGICLGHQAIVAQFGNKLKKVTPAHGILTPIIKLNSVLFHGVEEGAKVVRYHSWVVEETKHFSICASTPWDNQEVTMAVQHERLPLFGIQFHPESILTKCGVKILENWLQTIQPK